MVDKEESCSRTRFICTEKAFSTDLLICRNVSGIQVIGKSRESRKFKIQCNKTRCAISHKNYRFNLIRKCRGCRFWAGKYI